MKRMSLFVPAALGLALVLLPGVAVGEDEPPLPPTSQFFDEYDGNADGKVTMDEFRGAAEVFKLLDKDGDGAITPEELGLPADYRPDPKRKRPAAGGEAPAGDRRRGGDGRADKLRERLKAMDANQDGRITKDEWQGPEQLFDRLDRNQDGVLDQKDRPERGGGAGPRGRDKPQPGAEDRPDPAAIEKQVKERVAKQFAKLDANQDGKLAGEEIPNPRLLEMADADKDGVVTLAELQKVHLERAMRRGGGAKRDGARKGGASEERGPRGPRITGATLKRWDGDGDGKVSAEEFPGRDEMFERLDVDGDGFLTAADLKAAKKKAKAAAPDAPPTTERPDLIGQMDADGDGRLNRAEFKGSDEAWKHLDRNQDGWVDAAEAGGGK